MSLAASVLASFGEEELLEVRRPLSFFVLTPVSRHNASCYAKIENDLRYTQQTSYNTTFTETETGTDVTATGERP